MEHTDEVPAERSVDTGHDIPTRGHDFLSAPSAERSYAADDGSTEEKEARVCTAGRGLHPESYMPICRSGVG